MTAVASERGSTTIGRPCGGESYSVSENGRFVFTKILADRPSKHATGHFPSCRAVTQITHLNENLLKAKKVGNVEEIRYKSSHDGQDIHGWVITPQDFDPDEKYPLILEIHGGSYANYGARFSSVLQLMATEGYVVLYTNPRGSTSYETEFAVYINHNYPSEDHDDLMSRVDYMLEQGYIDEERLYITGGSDRGI